MAFQIVDCDNIRETHTGDGTAVVKLAGAAQYSNAAISKLANGDTSWWVVRAGAEFSEGIFTFNTGTPNTLTQTTVWKSSNSNAAVSFSLGAAGEAYIDLPAHVLDELNLSAITVASATTCDIGAAQAAKIIISGTVTITSLGTSAHKRRFVHFSGAMTLTHNATSLILPGAANITTAAGDTAIFLSDSSGNWRCYAYMRAGFAPPPTAPVTTVRLQKFTASGTYTPDANMLYCIAEVQAAGGGGGGAAVTGASQVATATGGGGGGYSRKLFAAATIGASQSVTVGAAGAAGAAGANNGGAGGGSSLGALLSTTGGAGGSGAGAFGAGQAQLGVAGGTGSSGDVNVSGGGSEAMIVAVLIGIVMSTAGGRSFFGAGGVSAFTGGTAAGNAGTGFGGGGSGAANYASQPAAAGGAGAPGVVIVTEFCSK